MHSGLRACPAVGSVVTGVVTGGMVMRVTVVTGTAGRGAGTGIVVVTAVVLLLLALSLAVLFAFHSPVLKPYFDLAFG